MSPSGWIPKVWLPFALLRSYKQRAMAVTTLGFLFSCDGSHPVDPSADRDDLFDGKAAVQPITGPSSLAAVAASETRIDLTWVDNSSNESGFELYRSTTGETGTFEVRSLPSANATAYTEASAQPGTQYCFKIRAERRTAMKSTYSEFSNIACATTPEPPPPPPPLPSPPNGAYGLEVVPISSTSVWMHWDWGSGATEGHGVRIERSLGGETNWSSIGTLSGMTNFSDTGADLVPPGLPSDQQVCYRVIAYNNYGEASPSNADCTAPPKPPTNLVGTTGEDGAVELSWSDNSAVEDGYEVWIQIIGASYLDCELTCYTEISDYVIGDLPANSTSYTCYNECADRPTYVKAKKDAGSSDPSNIISVP